MQAFCKQNITGSFQILRLISFVHVVHQIGGVLDNPPTTKDGGGESLIEYTFYDHFPYCIQVNLPQGIAYEASCNQGRALHPEYRQSW